MRYIWSTVLDRLAWTELQGSCCFDADKSHPGPGDLGGGGFDKISNVLEVPELLG